MVKGVKSTVKKQKHLVIAAAGTGGHVMPGLAVAREMQQRGWTVSWIGTQTGMERDLVQRQGIDFDSLDFTGIRGKGVVHALKGTLKLIRSAGASVEILEHRAASAVFSTGGYVAVPAAWAAKRRALPLVLMNCDADPLLSVKAVMPWAQKVMCGFEGTCAQVAAQKAVVCGNPVREEILALPEPEQRLANRTGALRIFVFGGSLGARILNETLPKTLALMPEGSRPEIIHQVGRGNEQKVKQAYEELGVQAQVHEFIHDMHSCYEWADLVISRSGATSVSELCAAGMASILVPFVVSTTSHQLGNARYMSENGASYMFEQSHFNAQALQKLLAELTREKILSMSQKARALARHDAAKTVADTLEALSR